MTRALLGDTDALLRSHGIAVVRQFGLTDLHPLLRELQRTETDPWVRYDLNWCLSEQPSLTLDDQVASAALDAADEPPF